MTPITRLEYLIIVRLGEGFGYSRDCLSLIHALTIDRGYDVGRLYHPHGPVDASELRRLSFLFGQT